MANVDWGDVRDADDDDDDLREYDLEHYDSDVVDGREVTGAGGGAGLAMFGDVKSLAYYGSNGEDPYITLAATAEEEDEEREELQVLATDNMLVAAKVEDEIAHLEVYIYEDEMDNLYVHHDVMLPAIPLCVEWLDVPVRESPPGQRAGRDERGNFVAVGTMDPEIELWDLDTVDCMYPNAILGAGGRAGLEEGAGTGTEKKKTTKKTRKKTKKVNEEYHVAAVLALAANRNHRTLLASASADQTVKLWDLTTVRCAKSYAYHTDKVCSLAWHPTQTTVLLSGSYDRTVVAADMRAPAGSVPRWGVESDVEHVRWNPHDPQYFFVTTEEGVVHYRDMRVVSSTPGGAGAAVWTLQAHDGAVSAFDVSGRVAGLMVTGGTDKTVKVWDVQGGPRLVVGRDLGVGKVFSTTFGPDGAVGLRVAVAGSRGELRVWDTGTNAAVRGAFGERVGREEEGGRGGGGGEGAGGKGERVVGVERDGGRDGDSEEDEEGAERMDHD